MKRLIFLLPILLLTNSVFTQIQKENGVNANKLVKTLDGKFHHSDSTSKLFTGAAYSLHPNNNISLYWNIVNGTTVRFIEYSDIGRVILEENYNSNGFYSGKYFQGTELGDTIKFGNYLNGKKVGKWLLTNSSGKRLVR